MKKKLLGMIMAAVLLIAGASGGVVHALPPETDVTGIVTDGGTPVPGAMVTVKCGATTKTDTTNASGTYLVSFTAAECPPGSLVTVAAKKGTKAGTTTGRVVGITTKLNVGLVNIEIPEYGWLGGLLALGAGTGTVIFVRRRYAGQSSSL